MDFMAIARQMGQASAAALNETLLRVLSRLDCIGKAADESATASTGTARTLAYMNGAPPPVGSPASITPRQMTMLPSIYEDTTTSTAKLDVKNDTGRCASSGWLSNLGDDPFTVQLVGYDGGSTAPFTLPVSATFMLPCFVSALHVHAVAGKPAVYSAVLS